MKRRTRDWQDDIAETTSSQVEFVVTVREPTIEPATPVLGNVVQASGEEPEATTSAEAEINYRHVRGTFKVPGKHAGHLLDTVTFGLGIAGMVGGPVAILKWAVGALPAGTQLAICAIYLVAFGGLTGVVIYRRRG